MNNNYLVERYKAMAHKSASESDIVNKLNLQMYDSLNMSEYEKINYRKELETLIEEKLYFIRHLAFYAKDQESCDLDISSMCWQIKDLFDAYKIVPCIKYKYKDSRE